MSKFIRDEKGKLKCVNEEEKNGKIKFNFQMLQCRFVKVLSEAKEKN